MNKVTNTSHMTGTDAGLFLLDASFRGPGAIEAQEARGQKELVMSDVLPVECDKSFQAELEAAGVKFGAQVQGDDLFREVTLPKGWVKRATDHSMWSELVDDKGTVRAMIFYKAAFYDRCAFMRKA